MFRIITAYAKMSKLSQIHPIEKILLAVLPIIIVGYSKNAIIPAINILVFIVLHIISKNPLKTIAKFTIGIALFAMFSSITFVFDYGIKYCSVIILRTISGALCLTFLAFTTPIDDILSLLSKHESLRDMCDITKSMERFLILIEDEYTIMYNAMKCRGGFDGRKRTIKSLGKIGALLFVNSIRRWKEIKNGIDSRCYNGCLHYSNRTFKISIKRVLVTLLYSCFIIIMNFMLWRRF